MTHFGVMILFAACVATVFATLHRASLREQLRLGARIFAAMVVGAVALGWIMLLFR
jgi:hypothetical protein